MPSTLVHMAVGALLGAAMLDEKLDKWALIAIVLAAMLPDLDAFISIFVPGMHRTLFHNLFFPVILFAPIYWDQKRKHSFLRRHWGQHAKHVMLACFVALTVAGIGLDVVGSGVNLFYPVQDQYYHVTGVLAYDAQRGLQNTLLDFGSAERGSTADIDYGSVKDTRSRIPVFGNGMQLLFSIAAFLIVGYRLKRAGELELRRG